MDAKAIDQLLESQRQYFLSGATLPVEFRIAMLQRLRETVRRREPDISKALTADLGKSGYEGYMCEIGLVLSELGYLIRHTRRFAKRRHVPTTLAQFAASSYLSPSPYGNVLIMSPWNYPLLLTLDPLRTLSPRATRPSSSPAPILPPQAKSLTSCSQSAFPRSM